MKLWTVSELNKAEASEIQTKYELPAIVAMLLQIRNIKTQEEIEDFLYNIDLFSKATYIKVIPDTLSNYRKPAHETLVSAYAPEFFDLCKRKYTLDREYLKTVNAETEEYLQLLIHCLEVLSPDLVIHRLTGDGPKDLLIAPLWSSAKRTVLNTLHQELKRQNTWQGRLYTN